MRFNKLGNKIEKNLEKLFIKLMKIEYKHPFLFIIISIIIIGILFPKGLQVNETPDSSLEKVWVPQDSIAIENLNFYKKKFGKSPKIQSFLIEVDDVEEDILKRKSILIGFEILKDIESIKDYDKLCLRGYPFGPCLKSGLLDYWNWNLTKFNLESSTDEKVKEYLKNSSSSSLNLSTIVGDLNKEKMKGKIYKLNFLMNPTDSKSILEWELKFQKKFKDYKKDGVLIYSESGRFSQDEISRAILSDLNLIFIAIGLISLCIFIAIGSFKKEHSSLLIAFSGIIVITTGIFVGIGMGGYLKIPFTSTCRVSPFLILGLGADSIFIIFNALKHSKYDKEKRFTDALSHSGVAILISTLTNIAAFGIGGTSKLPGISSFCLYTALSLIFVFILQLIFFIPICMIDFKLRKDSNRLDVLCCIKTSSNNQPLEPIKRSFTSKLLQYKIGPFILNKHIKKIIIIISIGYLGYSIYNITQNDIEFNFEDLIPLDSLLIEKIEKNKEYFKNVGQNFLIVLKDEDYHKIKIQDDINKLIKELIEETDYINSEFKPINWLKSYLDWLIGKNTTLYQLDNNFRPINKESFYNNLDSFLQQNPKYSKDIVFNNKGIIISSQITLNFVPFYSSQMSVNAMFSTRNKVNEFNLKAFPFNFSFIIYEQYSVIGKEIVLNMLLAIFSVFVISSILLIHPIVGFLVFLNVTIVDIYLIGTMGLWGITINVVSVTNLIIAAGMNVDESSHLGHRSMIHTGLSNNERILKAFSTIGPSVLLGALSTFLGVLVLAFSNSIIFRIFFKMFFLTILFSIINSFGFLSILFSYFLPKNENEHTSSSSKEIETWNELDSISSIQTKDISN